MENPLGRGRILITAVAVALLVLAGYRWWLVAQLDADWLPIGFVRHRLSIWAAALGAATAWMWLADRPWNRALGIALMTVPLWQPVFGFLNSIPDLVASDSVRQPLSRERLSNQYIFGLTSDLGYIGVGFLIWLGRVPPSFAQLARAMVAAGVPARREGRSAWHGFLLLPPLLLGSILLNGALRSSAALNNGDEASIWDLMTPYHDIMISLTAGFTEELIYRAVGIAIIAGLLTELGASKRGALAGAVIVQAIIFGAAHGGYGTWAHVLLPLAFGLFAGIVYLWLGIWSVVVVHVLVDVYAFAGYTSDGWPWFVTALTFLLLANTLITAGWSLRWLWRKFNTRSLR
ncbi:MAG: type II CAAX prenyl endopeptidase Rce1 family protein [Thermoplasmatota archaeon]